MTDSDILIGGEPINADTIGLDSRLDPKKKKQYIIIGSISLVILVLIIIIIVLAITSNGSSENKNESEGKGSNRDPNSALGEITLHYSVRSTEKPTLIISENFEQKSDIDIYDGTTYVPYTTQYTFSQTGNRNLNVKIFSELSMNSMFKGVSALTQVNMKSENNLKITSLESTFEDCTQLSNFEIKGFDTSKITSVKNSFHNTNLGSIDLKELNLDNVKDMSYMFANTKLTSIDLSGLKTEQVESMEGMFKNSEQLNSLDLSNFNTQSVKEFRFIKF